MKRTVAIAVSVVTLAILFGQAVSAGEPTQGRVPAAVLRDLGLGGLQPVTDAAAMNVRGSSSFAVAGGGSLVWGQLQFMDQITMQVTVDSSSDHSFASVTNTGLSQVGGLQGSSIAAGFTVLPTFSGSFNGLAGSAATPFAGFSWAYGQ